MNSIDRRLKEIETRIKEISEIIDVKHKQWDFSKDYYEYEKYLSNENKELEELSREKRMFMSYTLKDIPTYGNVMTLKNFIKNVKCGGFIDYDGSGNYIKDDKMTNITIYPSDVIHDSIRKEFDTIIWFNR